MGRAIVYIDGYNLYYGSIKDTAYKWLDVNCLAKRFAKSDVILATKYFTAAVIPRPNDPQQRSRQEIYWRALRTLPNLEVYEGQFTSHVVSMCCVDAQDRPTRRFERVIKTEEKGSDVNLASHLLVDAFDDKYDVAVVMTNDTDLLTPIQIIREKLGKKVMMINPHWGKCSYSLKKNSDYMYDIRRSDLQASQFDLTLMDQIGIFSKPTTW